MIMNSQISRAILKDLCRRYDLTEDQGKDIVKSEFKKVLLTMEEYDLETESYPVIRIPKFGVFFVKPSRKRNYGN